MWNQPNTAPAGQWEQNGQWGTMFNASAYQNMPHDQVDWATLAKQWIEIQQSGPPPPPPPEEPAPPPTSTALNQQQGSDNTVFASSWTSGWPQAGQTTIESYDYGHGGQMPIATSAEAVAPVAPSMAQTYDYNHGGAAVHSQMAPAVTHSQMASTAMHHNMPPPQGSAVSYNDYSTQGYDGGYGQYWGTDAMAPGANGLGGVVPPTMMGMPHVAMAATPYDTMQHLDAAKRKALPLWIREGLEKMEREKAKKEQEALRRNKREQRVPFLDESKKTDAGIYSSSEDDEEELPPANGDSDGVRQRSEEPHSSPHQSPCRDTASRRQIPKIILTPEEKLRCMTTLVRRCLTEILLDVTQGEMTSMAKYELSRAYRKLPARQAKRTPALATIAGVAAYSDSESEGESGGGEEEEVSEDEATLARRANERRDRFGEWERGVLPGLEREEEELEARLRRKISGGKSATPPDREPSMDDGASEESDDKSYNDNTPSLPHASREGAKKQHQDNTREDKKSDKSREEGQRKKTSRDDAVHSGESKKRGESPRHSTSSRDRDKKHRESASKHSKDDSSRERKRSRDSSPSESKRRPRDDSPSKESSRKRKHDSPDSRRGAEKKRNHRSDREKERSRRRSDSSERRDARRRRSRSSSSSRHHRSSTKHSSSLRHATSSSSRSSHRRSPSPPSSRHHKSSRHRSPSSSSSTSSKSSSASQPPISVSSDDDDSRSARHHHRDDEKRSSRHHHKSSRHRSRS